VDQNFLDVLYMPQINNNTVIDTVSMKLGGDKVQLAETDGAVLPQRILYKIQIKNRHCNKLLKFSELSKTKVKCSSWCSWYTPMNMMVIGGLVLF
jgi:hypothetical protein